MKQTGTDKEPQRYWVSVIADFFTRSNYTNWMIYWREGNKTMSRWAIIVIGFIFGVVFSVIMWIMSWPLSDPSYDSHTIDTVLVYWTAGAEREYMDSVYGIDIDTIPQPDPLKQPPFCNTYADHRHKIEHGLSGALNWDE